MPLQDIQSPCGLSKIKTSIEQRQVSKYQQQKGRPAQASPHTSRGLRSRGRRQLRLRTGLLKAQGSVGGCRFSKAACCWSVPAQMSSVHIVIVRGTLGLTREPKSFLEQASATVCHFQRSVASTPISLPACSPALRNWGPAPPHFPKTRGFGVDEQDDVRRSMAFVPQGAQIPTAVGIRTPRNIPTKYMHAEVQARGFAMHAVWSHVWDSQRPPWSAGAAGHLAEDRWLPESFPRVLQLMGLRDSIKRSSATSSHIESRVKDFVFRTF